MKTFSKTIKHTLIYAFGLILNRGIHIILVPFYTRNLDASTDYAIFELVTPLILLFVPILELGFATGLMRFYNKISVDSGISSLSKLFSTSLLFLIIFSIIGNAILYIFSDNISKLVFGSQNFSSLVILTGLLSSITVIGNQPLALMRSQEKSTTYIFICFFRSITGPVSIVLLIMYTNLGVYGILIGDIIGLSVMLLAGIVLCYKNIKLDFDVYIFKKLFWFSAPLTIGAIATTFITMFDRFFIRQHLGEEAISVYGLGFRIAMLFTFITRAFQIAWPATAFQLDTINNSDYIIADIYKKILVCICFMSLVLTMLSPELTIIMGPGDIYGSAYIFVPFITIGYILHMSAHYFNTNLAIAGKTFHTSLIICVSCIIKIIITSYLISFFGLIGAALSTFISFFAEAILAFIISQYYKKIPYNVLHLLLIIIFTILLSVLTIYSTIYFNLYSNYAIRFSVPILYIFMLIFFNVITYSDIVKFKYFIKRR